jgi:hypothetical protein
MTGDPMIAQLETTFKALGDALAGGAEAGEVKRVLDAHSQSVSALVARDKKKRELAKKQERWKVEGS